MRKKTNTQRRRFLKNVSLTSLALGILPNLSKAENSVSKETPIQDDCVTTTRDYYGQGPFYTENAPLLSDNQLAKAEEEGTRIVISGRVINLGCSEFIPNTEVDIWHADAAGDYDNDGFNLRGRTHSNEQGFYMFETIWPGKYLNGNQFRPAHIHFKITPPGFNPLITQLYFEGDTSIPADAAASITEGDFDATHRIIPLTETTDGKYEGTWDIVINGDGVTMGVNDLHLEKGMIYKIGPNPFEQEIDIEYGVFQPAQVSLLVYDIQGNLVANLEEEYMGTDKYTAVWRPDTSLVNGHYFVTLKVNDLQVHYLKVIKQ